MPIILAVAAFAFLGYLAFPPAFPFMQTDSMSFVNFEPMRTPGYPMFLAFVTKVSGGLEAAAPLQLAAMVAAAAFLALEIRRLTSSTLLGTAALLLIAANVFIYRYAFTIMSEAMFFSALAVLTAVICRFASQPRMGTVAAMSLIVAICILIRPVAYVLVPVVLLCAVVLWPRTHHKLRLILGVVLPMAAVLGAGSFVYYSYHGSFRTQSFLGHNLIGKIAYLPGTNIVSRFPDIVGRINSYMEPLRAVRVDDWRDRYLFRERHYDFVRYGLTTPAVQRRSAAGAGEEDAIRMEVARAFIWAHPLAYIDEFALQLYALWTVADLRTVADNERFERLIASLPFDPYKDTATPHRTPMPWLAVYGVRAFLLGIFVITLLSVARGAAALAQRKPLPAPWTALVLLSLLLNAYLILVAALQAGIFRYLVVTWPVIVTIGVIFANIALIEASRLWRRLRLPKTP